MKNKPSKNAHPKEEKSIDQNSPHTNSLKKPEEKTPPIKEDGKERRCSNSDSDSGSESRSDEKVDSEYLAPETHEPNELTPKLSTQLTESVHLPPFTDGYETKV